MIPEQCYEVRIVLQSFKYNVRRFQKMQLLLLLCFIGLLGNTNSFIVSPNDSISHSISHSTLTRWTITNNSPINSHRQSHRRSHRRSHRPNNNIIRYPSSIKTSLRLTQNANDRDQYIPRRTREKKETKSKGAERRRKIAR